MLNTSFCHDVCAVFKFQSDHMKKFCTVVFKVLIVKHILNQSKTINAPVSHPVPYMCTFVPRGSTVSTHKYTARNPDDKAFVYPDIGQSVHDEKEDRNCIFSMSRLIMK